MKVSRMLPGIAVAVVMLTAGRSADAAYHGALGHGCSNWGGGGSCGSSCGSTCAPSPCNQNCTTQERTVYETVWDREEVQCMRTVCETIYKDVERQCYRTEYD